MNDDTFYKVGVAAELARRYQEDELDFLETLAVFMENALPEATKVERNGAFWVKHRPVSRITLAIGSDRFVIQTENGALRTKIVKLAQGVSQRTECPSVAQWIESLSAALHARLGQSRATREALEKWLG